MWSLINDELFRIGLVDRPHVGGVHSRPMDPNRGAFKVCSFPDCTQDPPCMAGVLLVDFSSVEAKEWGGVPKRTHLFWLSF